MAASPWRLEFGLTCPALTTGLPWTSELGKMRGLVPDIGWFDPLRCPGNEGTPTEDLQGSSRQDFFGDPTLWWDNRRSKMTLRPPDLNLDSGTNKKDQSLSSSIRDQGAIEAHESPLEMGMCRQLCEDRRISEAVDALTHLVQQGLHVDKHLYYRVLKRCIAHKELVMGRRIHGLTAKSGYEGDAFLATEFIGLYASHGKLAEAMQVFCKVCTPSTYNWAAIISAHARHGEPAQAIRLYRQMHMSTTVKPSKAVYVAVLKACASAGDLVAGKDVHAHILARPGKPDIFIQTGLVSMYAKCGSLGDARQVFDALPERDIVAWTAMLAGYAQRGMGQEALNLYRTMQREGLRTPDSVTFLCLLQACASIGAGALDQGKRFHLQIEERGLPMDLVLGGSLVNMYAKCGSLGDARYVFDRLPKRDVVAWTAMFAGYAQQGMGQEALSLYSTMLHEGLATPDSVTYVCLLQACASVGVGALDEGKRLHSQILERGLQEHLVLGGSLVNMYAKCGSLEDARQVFDMLPNRNVVAWTAMLAGYAQQGMGKHALSLFCTMQQEGLTPPNSITFVCLLQACASVGVGALDHGKQLHSQIQQQGLQEDLVLGGSLVNMYAKCGRIEDARRVFDRLPEKNVVAWNAMLAGYAQQGKGQEAISLYSSMEQEGVSTPDSVTYVCILLACACVGAGALALGKQLHSQVQEQGLQEDLVLSASLVNMYAKCGSLGDARQMFDRLQGRDVVAWNGMLAAYAQQGMGQEALTLYSSMQQEGFATPDSVTYVCLLQACASLGVGALDQGKQLHSQIQEQGLQEDLILGGSLVNMYARCGSLEDARHVFGRLPKRDVVAWNVMLAGYAQQGMSEEALSLYSSMQEEGVTTPDCVTYVYLLQASANVGALPLGKQLHAQIQERELQADVVVGAALVNMYAKCGCMIDSQQVFDSLPERTIEAWGALIGGYSRQGDSEVVFDLFDRMRLDSILPDGITFLGVLTVCSHVGEVEKGRKYFTSMRLEFGISPTIEHYTCMVDLLGRAGLLDEALQMAKTMPLRPSIKVWHTLLSACRKWNDVEVALQAFDFAVSLDKENASSYVLMSNIYSSAQMWKEAKDMQLRRKKSGAWKGPGQSWCTDLGGVVHTFGVGENKPSEIEGTELRAVGTTSAKIAEGGDVLRLHSALRDITDEKEAKLCGHVR